MENYIEIAKLFYCYAIDDFLQHHANKERMKLIFYRYFIDKVDMIDVANEVGLSRERVRQIIDRLMRHLKHDLQTKIDTLEFIKNQAKKADIFEFECKRMKAKEAIEIAKSFENVIQDKNIDELDLSVRAYNILAASRIKSLSDLASYSKREILSFRNSGKQTLKELEETLKEHGYYFKK